MKQIFFRCWLFIVKALTLLLARAGQLREIICFIKLFPAGTEFNSAKLKGQEFFWCTIYWQNVVSERIMPSM